MTCFRERTRVKIGVLKKHALINFRERTRIWLHTRHQDEAIEPCGDGMFDVKGRREIAAKA